MNDINDLNNQMFIAWNIPQNTIKLEVMATIIDEQNNIETVRQIITLPQLYEARILGNKWECEEPISNFYKIVK